MHTHLYPIIESTNKFAFAVDLPFCKVVDTFCLTRGRRRWVLIILVHGIWCKMPWNPIHIQDTLQVADAHAISSVRKHYMKRIKSWRGQRGCPFQQVLVHGSVITPQYRTCLPFIRALSLKERIPSTELLHNARIDIMYFRIQSGNAHIIHAIHRKESQRGQCGRSQWRRIQTIPNVGRSPHWGTTSWRSRFECCTSYCLKQTSKKTGKKIPISDEVWWSFVKTKSCQITDWGCGSKTKVRIDRESPHLLHMIHDSKIGQTKCRSFVLCDRFLGHTPWWP